MVRQTSSNATTMFGDCVDEAIANVLIRILDGSADEARDAVNRLEMTGEPVDMLVRGANGQPYELIGKPAGAMIRLVLRDARLLDDRLRDAEKRVSAADDALQRHEWAQETMKGLIEEAPIITWHRTAEGTVNWSDGEIRTRGGSVSAAQAVDLIVARTKLNRQPVLAGQPQKSRIEIVVNDGAETVSLHVTEIVRQDGSRIGLATDAGTAASAERTLTRFVQTMTETFAHLTVGLAIFDRNQTLALFNPALVQMWQVEPAWLARRPSLRDIIDELRATRRLPELQDFHKWRTRLVNLFENTEAADYEELWHLADGSNIRVLARPHPHGSLAFIFDDVTERMRLEQRYRHSIDLRRATLDGLNEGIAVFGANGLLQFVNQSFHEIWGTDSESVYAAMHARQLVSFCEELTLEEDTWHRLHRFITGEESRRAWTARLTMRSGRVLTARFAPLPDGSTMAVFSDITESERIAVALRRRNGALTLADAARSAIHDRVSKTLQIEPANSSDGGTVRTTLEEIASLCIDDSTDVAVQDLGQNVHSMLERVALLLGHVADDKDVELSVGGCMNVDTHGIDGASVEQVVFKLVEGAVQRCAGGTTLSLSSEGSDDAMCVSMTATTEKDSCLADGVADGTSFVVAIVHALTARLGGTVEIDDADVAKITVRCLFPYQDDAAGFLQPQMLRDVEDGIDSNVHPLTPASAR